MSKVSSEGYITGGYGEGKYMYITGGSFNNRNYPTNIFPIPSLTKIDTSGNVIWTAIDPAHYTRQTAGAGLFEICKNVRMR